MADALPTSKYYQLLGGVNLKASQYEMSTAQFLNIRNMDFDVPNALAKRPGSSYMVGPANGTSGPITNIFEFIQLNANSTVVCSSNTALFYITNNAFTLLSPGWGSINVPDMLTFVNKLWVADGGKWAYYTGSSFLPVGYISAPSFTTDFQINANISSSTCTVAGDPHFVSKSNEASFITVGIWMAHSSVRADGYLGPIDFYKNAQQLVTGRVNNAGDEYFTSQYGATGLPVSGFTSNPGATAIAIWLARDQIAGPDIPAGSSLVDGHYVGLSEQKLGNGIVLNVSSAGLRYFANTLAPNFDVTLFKLYTMIPTNTATFWINISSWNAFIGSNPQSFSAMAFNFFATYTPKYIEINNNTMFSAGFSQSPSTVFFSDVGDPETVQPDNNFEVRTNDGDKIFGMKTFNNQLMIMKERSFHRLIGTSADNYQLIQISDQYGCLNKHTIVQYQQKCLWLDRRGILEYNGASFDIISTPVEGIFRRMSIGSAKLYATAVHHVDRKQIWWGIPIDQNLTPPFDQVPQTNNITVVYDYSIGAWTFFDGYNPASYAVVKNTLLSSTVWRGDYSGMVHFTGASFFNDSGQGITCLLQPRYENMGGENQTTLWRRLFLDSIANTSGVTGQIQGQVFSNYDSSTVKATFSVYQDKFQNRIEMGVLGKAVSVQLSHYSASLPLVINGYGWANRGLRNV